MSNVESDNDNLSHKNNNPEEDFNIKVDSFKKDVAHDQAQAQAHEHAQV